jgi:GNAT superfamily N-acetyltransferase
MQPQEKNERQIRLATEDDVPKLRALVNAAYSELNDLGLNFTGTYQDEAMTRERMHGCEVYLVYEQGHLSATISLRTETIFTPESTTFERCLYVNQLAVHPDRKRRGLGTWLLDFAETRARQLNLQLLRLDTAKPAHHLVQLYQQRGYSIVDEVQWEGKTYRSYIMEKVLAILS